MFGFFFSQESVNRKMATRMSQDPDEEGAEESSAKKARITWADNPVAKAPGLAAAAIVATPGSVVAVPGVASAASRTDVAAQRTVPTAPGSAVAAPGSAVVAPEACAARPPSDSES